MSDFYGIVSVSDRPVDASWLSAMQTALEIWTPDVVDHYHDDQVGFGQNTLHITPESFHEQFPFCHRNCVLVANARIDNRDDLVHMLNIRRQDIITDALLIVEAYLKWGDDCSKCLVGEYAFVIWDESKKHLLCSKDAMGTRPLYYAKTKDYFLFASELRGILSTGLVSKELNDEFLALQLTRVCGESTQTIYKEIFPVSAAHSIILDQGRIIKSRHWYLPVDEQLSFNSNRDYEEAFVELVKQAVARRLRSAFPVGGLLSGGLDSTSVIGTALKEELYDQPLHLFSWSTPDNITPERRDDRSYIDSFLRMHQNSSFSHKYLHGLEGYFSLMPKFQTLCDQPFRDMELYMRGESYLEAQKQGVRTLIGGIGGDEGISYPAIEYTSDLISRGRFVEFFKTMLESGQNGAGWRKTWRRHLSAPIRDMVHGRESWGRGDLHLGPNSTGRKEDTNLWGEGLLNTISFDRQVRAIYNQAISDAPDVSPLKQKLYFNLSKGFHQVSFDRRYHISLAYGMLNTYPLLDRDLLDFFAKIPIDQYYKHGQGRSMIRRSMKQYVPSEILKRNTKYMTSPLYLKRVRNDGEWLENMINTWRKNELINYYVNTKEMAKEWKMFRKGEIDRPGAHFFFAAQTCNFLSSSF